MKIKKSVKNLSDYQGFHAYKINKLFTLRTAFVNCFLILLPFGKAIVENW